MSVVRAIPNSAWVECVDQNGLQYFWNTSSNQTTWESPFQQQLDENLEQSDPNYQAYLQQLEQWQQYQQTQQQNVPIEPQNETTQPQPIVDETRQNKKTQSTEKQQKTDRKAPLGKADTIPPKRTIYTTKEERVSAFNSLLNDLVGPQHKTWDEAFRIIVKDQRYLAIPSLEEKKYLFEVYAKLHQEVPKVKEELSNKDRFIEMLIENYENGTLEPTDQFRARFQVLLAYDKRLKAITNEEEREDLWDLFVEQAEELKKKKLLEKKKEALLKFYDMIHSDHSITRETTWRSIQKNYVKDNELEHLDLGEAIEVFDELIEDLDRKYETEQRLFREKQRMATRKLRGSFFELLYECTKDERMTINTTWKQFGQIVQNDPRYLDIADDKEINAKGMFREVMKELETKYKTQKKGLKKMVKFYKIKVTPQFTVDELVSILSFYHKEILNFSKTNLSVFVEELKLKMEKKSEKRAKKRAKREQTAKEPKENL